MVPLNDFCDVKANPVTNYTVNGSVTWLPLMTSLVVSNSVLSVSQRVSRVWD